LAHVPDLGLQIVGQNIEDPVDNQGALSESELHFAENQEIQNENSMANEERRNIMEQLGDFSMSGMTGSHLYNGQSSQINMTKSQN
jgi:hypothetical protein